MSPERRIRRPVELFRVERFVTVTVASPAPASMVSGVALKPLVTLTLMSSVSPVVTTVTVFDSPVPLR